MRLTKERCYEIFTCHRDLLWVIFNEEICFHKFVASVKKEKVSDVRRVRTLVIFVIQK